MKTQKWLVISGTVTVAMLALLLVTSQGSSARVSAPVQQPDGNNGSEEIVGPEAVNFVGNVIVYQGHLTDDGGNPINGTVNITFRLYTASTGGTVLCQDTDPITVEDGLFTAYVNGCTPSDIDGKAIYLGVQVAGDSEMTPRRPIYPVPYAFSLRPGARISASMTSAIVHAENTHASGRGLRGYATSDSGTNYGVVGASTSPDGYGGYFYNDQGGTGVYGRGKVGGRFVTPSGLGPTAVLAQAGGAFGAGVKGEGNALSYGVWAHNPDNIALYATGGGAGAAAYISGDMTVTGSKTGYVVDIAQNAGAEPLQTGDVVVVTGYSDPVVGRIPLMLVSKVYEAASTGVVGVVDRAATFDSPQLPAGIESDHPLLRSPDFQPLLAPRMRQVEAPAGSGEYVSVVTLGLFHTIKVDASSGAIQPGDLLVSSTNPGYARKASDPAKPGTIIGKALGALEEGTGTIPVLITLQ